MSNNDDYVINLYMHMKIKDQYAIGPAADKSKIYSQVNVYHSSDNKTTMIKYKTNDNIPFCITMTRTLFDNRSIIPRVTELILDLYQLLFNINTRTPKAATIADVSDTVLMLFMATHDDYENVTKAEYKKHMIHPQELRIIPEQIRAMTEYIPSKIKLSKVEYINMLYEKFKWTFFKKKSSSK